MRTAIYPGTFDPITIGHMDIIKRALHITDRLIVGVALDTGKESVFDIAMRGQLVKKDIELALGKDSNRVEVQTFSGLLVNFAEEVGANILIRGLRAISDFEYEFQMALTNRRLAQDVETVFLMPSEDYSFLSSRLLKETGSLGANLSSFVPDFIAEKLKEKLKA